jgi:Holliday junction resolvasome RuvABC endonuclease subunit
MPVVIGIDPSSVKLAAVICEAGDEPNATIHVQRLPTDKPEACVAALEWVRTLVELAGSNDVHVYIEYPVMGRGGPGSTIPQALINGALQAGAKMAGAKVYSVNNAHCKKVVVGKGNASKDDIKAWVKKAWPGLYEKIGKDQDLCDSAMIYVYGKRVVERRSRMSARKELGTRIIRRRSSVGR